jgi:type I restriction enzyme S subunit
MKNSGIEWIGEIPEHWEVRKLKYVCKNLNNRRVPIEATIRGRMSKRVYDYYGSTGIIDKVDDYLFDEPTIIIAEDGANLLLRNIKLIYLADGKYWVNNHAHILTTINGNDRFFIANVLEMLDYTIFISGAAQPKLTKEKLMNVEILIPPISEQYYISLFVKNQSQKIDTAIELQQKQIEKLKEYRMSLIDSVVTGKVKVAK